MSKKLDEETSYKLLKLLNDKPDMSQRELAEAMGVSLGKINYCLKSLLDIGFLKMKRFKESNNKLGYSYVLTPKGIRQRAHIAIEFLKIKNLQYEKIKQEILNLQNEIDREKKI